MDGFLNGDFLLKTETSRQLYHNFAAKQPIIDYHCHINPADIAGDIKFSNITGLWLGGDHYKWRLMRAAGVPEEYITGGAPDYDKFLKWAGVLSYAAGNPLYHWSRLELRNYFGYDGILSAKTAGEVWEIANGKLKDMSAKGIVKSSGAEVVCTTDDPADSLEHHKKIAEDKDFGVSVYPAWRPDKALNIEKEDFPGYIKTLSEISGVSIESFGGLCEALGKRMEYFDAMGCKTSDHGLAYVTYVPAGRAQIEGIFEKRKTGGILSDLETQKYKTALMLFMGGKYAALGWVMQLHFGVKRNNNTAMFKKIGADTGYDCIYNYSPFDQTSEFLNALDIEGALPKTVLYGINPSDNAYISTLAGCFPADGIKSKIQHGSAWWFNDHKKGMTEHLESLASMGYLAGFIGMLTDSRSLISYPRHEYFRRILCGFLGKLAEDGEFTSDMDVLGKIVLDVSYNNAKEYFGF